MKPYIISFADITQEDLAAVGGKGLNLGKLAKIEEIHVPDGFCVTTDAYKRMINSSPQLVGLLDTLANLTSADRNLITTTANDIRAVIEGIDIGKEIEGEITKALRGFNNEEAFAIRSSATAEDLPHASFAGQQDTYLNIKGTGEILRHIGKCWASLFTDRAIAYRMQHGFDHRNVHLSVVVQKMVASEAAGTMFTADPMTSDRASLTIDASFGLGEALVSGLVNPDSYKVKAENITEKSIGVKELEIKTAEQGILETRVDGERQKQQVLTDDQVKVLAEMGKTIENEFGTPQDIEWCQSDGRFYIVQSRAITTLFPLPDVTNTRTPRVYMSIGHIQMMTDAIKPLGMSFFEMISDVRMDRIGGRLFSDITHDLSSKVGRARLVMATGKQDLLIQGALKNLTNDKVFLASLPKGKRNIQGGVFNVGSIAKAIQVMRKNDPVIINHLTRSFETDIEQMEQQLSKCSGDRIFDFIEKDKKNLLAMAYHPTMLGAIIAAILTHDSLNKKIAKWLGDKNAADTLAKSLDHNVTTEMGQELCDVADTIRQQPAVLEYLAQRPEDKTFFETMQTLPGGKESYAAFQSFFVKFGMRCPGEIDITKARFEEKPTQLIPLLLNNIHLLEPGEHRSRFQSGKEEAQDKEEDILRRIASLRGGRRKVKKIKKNIRLLRNFSGCREDPKYYIVRRFQVYKKAMMKEAQRLVDQGTIKAAEDVFYLYMDELREVVRTNTLDAAVIEKRKEAFVRFEKLTPPRVFTSDGYVPPVTMTTGNLPDEAIPGIPVSSGVVEGRARVVLSVDEADVEEGDILVTQFTDPSWTPLFVTIKGLVTEVGGFTTHGAVVTREYGLPGVVGVQNATKRIKDGQRIRVNGTEGYVEILEDR
ncbi:rifamycin-inactivating phosphotransferase [Aureibacillus halotolerans]|uniref:Rifampicin phosphotransferase n=1 Tax=Aureibacillus halotolerans TaxID=1508390 RepID=A0A4R6TYQ7_9BACI|nr:rifamycin-inactivating phosphotransferase [Aureibacillus halotolerans]TDQ39088.1 pyruvate,water dikinase [Aureibacillus halotolerans]